MDVRNLQFELYKILQIIDQFCKENQIDYSLFGGTLLGAVRHKGFIPWDDDIDICMTRDNYEKFAECWNRSPVEGYFFQNIESDPEWTQPFAKIRKEQSTFIEYEFQKECKHTGLYIDILILDKVHEKGLLKALDWLEWNVYFLCIRDKLRLFIEKKHHTDHPSLTRRVTKIYRNWFRKRLLSRCGREDLALADVIGYKVINRRYASDLCNSYIPTRFEDSEFPIMKNYEKFLTKVYGDYMKYPPINERINKHHPLIIDFSRSYEEIREQQLRSDLEEVTK